MPETIMNDVVGEGIDRRKLLQALGAGGVAAFAGCTDVLSGGGGEDSIQFLTMNVGENIEGFFDEYNDQFEEEHDATLDFTTIAWDNAQQVLNNRIDGGEAPDVSRLPARWIPQFVGRESLEPLDDLMQGDFLDKFPEGVANSTRYQGSYYGVPWAASAKCLFYNKDVFEEAGLDPEDPTLDTWDDMLDAAIEIRDNTDTPAVGLAAGDRLNTASQYYHYHWSYGADLIDDDFNPVVNQDGAAEALQFYADLNQEHDVTQAEPLASIRSDIRQLFEAGELGMVIGHTYTGLNIDDAQEEGDVDFEYDIVQVPQGPEGRYSLYTIDCLVVYSQTEVEDLSHDLMEFYMDEDRRFEYSRDKGFLPVTEAVGERDYFQDHDVWQHFIEANEYARARPKMPNFNEFNNRIVTAIQEAVAGDKSGQEALDDAQADLEDVMS